MRYSPEHKQKTREKVVQAASKVFRQQGYHAAGVDRVMEEAGLTAGAFYAHFPSKEALFSEAFTCASQEAARLNLGGLDSRSGKDWIVGFLERYLSPLHRRMVVEGCPIPALASEISRAGDGPRLAFEEALVAQAEKLGRHLPEAGDLDRESNALAIIALCVGGLSLARAVTDEALADRILEACRALALQGQEGSAADVKNESRPDSNIVNE